MSKTETSPESQLVDRLVRLENRVSVVLASFAADIVHLRSEIRQAQADLLAKLVDSLQTRGDAAASEHVRLFDLTQTLGRDLVAIDDNLTIQQTKRDAFEAAVNTNAEQLQTELMELTRHVEAQQALSGLSASKLDTLEARLQNLVDAVPNEVALQSAAISDEIGKLSVLLLSSQTIALEGQSDLTAELKTVQSALAQIDSRHVADATANLDANATLTAKLAEMQDATVALEIGLQAEAQRHLDRETAATSQLKEMQDGIAALDSGLQAEAQRHLDRETAATSQLKEMQDGIAALDSGLQAEAQRHLDRETAATSQLKEMQDGIAALDSGLRAEAQGHLDREAAVTAKLADISQAVTEISGQVLHKLGAQLTGLDTRLQSLERDQVEQAVAISTQFKHVEERDRAEQTQRVNLSMQLQATEQRTLSGLLQVQTDSANRTNELSGNLATLDERINQLDGKQTAQKNQTEANLRQVVEAKVDALHRLVVASDHRQQIHEMSVVVKDMAHQAAVLEARQADLQVALENQLAQHKTDVVEAMRALLLEERKHLFNFKFFKN
jgi:hypothetical protein